MPETLTEQERVRLTDQLKAMTACCDLIKARLGLAPAAEPLCTAPECPQKVKA